MAKVIVDAFGGDNSPLEPIKGAVAAHKKWRIGIALSGERRLIEAVASENGIDLSDIEIIGAEGVIDIHEDPGEILKSRKNCSMAVGLKALAAGEGDAFVSAGSTGALLMGATFLVKRIKGVKRPALCTNVPTPKSSYLLLDSGANADCRPDMLYSFGVMGAIYAENVLGRKNPRVALLNIGAEDTKGGTLQLETYKLLKEDKSINFIGNAEARDVPSGVCDVLVTDGFSGNVVLKLTEGVSATFFRLVKGVFLKNFKTKIAAAIIKKDLSSLKKYLDYSEHGGAPLVGVKAPVIKAHGASQAKAFMNAVRVADNFAKSGAVDKITAAFSAEANKNA